MTERILLLGGGGREHAIARAIVESTIDHELYAGASNRNPGIVAIADEFTELDETDPDVVLRFADRVDASIAVIGPESPLASGVSDALTDAGVYTFAPSQADARIETDKAWQRAFMDRENIPGCPAFEIFDDQSAAAEYVQRIDHDVAVKPQGLTGGKGVRVTGDQLTRDEAATYIKESPYSDWVIEERLIGEEFTVQAFVANGTIRTTPAIQDHKRAFEGDEGPNTGGMGSYSDNSPLLPFMTESDYEEAIEIIEATVDALDSYRGVLYGQFMLTAEGPKVIEFNARFGDPEAMNTLPTLETDFGEILVAARDGDALPPVEVDGRATVCKYAVPEGYPTDPKDGTKISVDEATIDSVNERYQDSPGTEAMLFYASVDDRSDGIYTTTSRSFAVVGLAEELHLAEEIAESALSAAGDGVRIRHDIGTDSLIEQRIEHMRRLRG